MSNSRQGFCVYCGNYGDVTSEHVIPQCLFAKPRPNNLVTVPCCRNCNSGKSMDDEYLKTVLAMRDITYNHPDVQSLYKGVERSLNRPTKISFARYIKNNTVKLNTFTESGIFTGIRTGYNVNFTRINASVEFICRGLYYHEFKKIINLGVNLDAFCTEQIDHIDPILDNILINILKTKKHVIGNDVFTYWFGYDNDNMDCSLWIFTFYKKVHFVALTDPSKKHGHTPISIV